MIVFFFYFFCIFLVMSILLVFSSGAENYIVWFDEQYGIQVRYAALFFNFSTLLYLIWYFASIDERPYKIYLIGFFVGISIMLGVGGATAFHVELAESELLTAAFGRAEGAWFILLIATGFSGYCAREYLRNNLAFRGGRGFQGGRTTPQYVMWIKSLLSRNGKR